MAGIERLSFDDPLAQLVADAHEKWNNGFLMQTGSGTAYEAIADALRANPEVVLGALGYPNKKECADRWVCCIHLLTDEERARA